MTTNIKGTNIELTKAIIDYVNKKLNSIKKVIASGYEVDAHIEVGKTTNHHKQGDYFKAEFDMKIDGEKFFTTSEKSDLYKAIDEAKDQIVDKIVKSKKRKNTLFKRGAISVKKMVKGVSKRNPFTSKY